MRRGDEEGGCGVSAMKMNESMMVKYGLNNNAQKIRSVRTPTDRDGIESATNKVTLLVPELSKGVYFYKYNLKNGEQNYSGKLNGNVLYNTCHYSKYDRKTNW